MVFQHRAMPYWAGTVGAAFGRGQSSVAIRTAEREAFVLVTTDTVKFAEDEMEAPGWTQRYLHVKAVKCCQDNSVAVPISATTFCVMLWGAVRSLWSFIKTKFVCVTLPSHHTRKVSYVATQKDILRSLFSVFALVLWADPCVLQTALWVEEAAASHVTNIHLLVTTWVCKILPWKSWLQQLLWWAKPSLQID